MTLEEKRIAIAEACGWTLHPWGALSPSGMRHETWGLPVSEALPNYFIDLNAMYVAEMIAIIPLDGPDYYHELEAIIERDRGIKIRDRAMLGFSGWLTHATAAQRAEAFGKTRLLWK